MELKDKLKQYRRENKLTQEQFGEKIGLKRSTVAEMERGRIKGTLAVISKISEISGLSMSYWLEETDNTINIKKYESLDILIDTMLEKGLIKKDGKIPTGYYELVIGILEKEIALKIEETDK